MSRLCLVLLLLFAGCSFNELYCPGATSPAVAHAATYVVGGKKGWPGVKSWTVPSISVNDVLVFKWGNKRFLDCIFGPKHSVATPSSFTSFENCNTKDVAKMVVKPARKAKKSYTVTGDFMFFSTIGKDCQRGIKFEND